MGILSQQGLASSLKGPSKTIRTYWDALGSVSGGKRLGNKGRRMRRAEVAQYRKLINKPLVLNPPLR